MPAPQKTPRHVAVGAGVFLIVIRLAESNHALSYGTSRCRSAIYKVGCLPVEGGCTVRAH